MERRLNRFSVGFRRLVSLAPALLMAGAGHGCSLAGDYEIHVNNRTSFPATISLDGMARIKLAAGTHDVLGGVNRSPHTLEAKLQGKTLSASLQLEIPAIPEGAAVFVCVLLTEGGLVSQSLGAEDCAFGTTAPTAAVSFTALDRVPVNQTRRVLVTLQPPPPPGASPLVLAIGRTSGNAGAAVFCGGQTRLEISQGTTICIQGIANSDVADNMDLVATLDGTRLFSQPFSVRTWPRGMVRTGAHANARYFGGAESAPGVYEFEYEIQSESGNLSDLQGLMLRELLQYAGTESGVMIRFPSPPFRNDHGNLWWDDNPSFGVGWRTVGVTVLKEPIGHPRFLDHHHVPTTMMTDDQLIGFSTPDHAKYEELVTQYYQFKDPVFLSGPMSGPQLLYGPNYLHRVVAPDAGGHWTYDFEKTDAGQRFGLQLVLP